MPARWRAPLPLWRRWPQLRHLYCDQLELRREDDLELARYCPSTFIQEDGRELRALPKSIRRLEVIGNAAFLKRAQPVLGKRFELVLRPRPSGLITGNKGSAWPLRRLLELGLPQT